MTVGGVTCTSHWSIVSCTGSDVATRARVVDVTCTRGTICSGRSGADDLGRAREAHVDLGGLGLRVRVADDGHRHLRERALDDLARDLDRRRHARHVVRSRGPGGRSIASCRVYLPSVSPSRRTRRRARAGGRMTSLFGPRARTRGGSADGRPLHHEARRGRADDADLHGHVARDDVLPRRARWSADRSARPSAPGGTGIIDGLERRRASRCPRADRAGRSPMSSACSSSSVELRAAHRDAIFAGMVVISTRLGVSRRRSATTLSQHRPLRVLRAVHERVEDEREREATGASGSGSR